MAIRFKHPIMQTLAESLIKLHGGSKDLLLLGTYTKYRILPGNNTMKETLEKMIKNKQEEVAALEALILLVEVAKLLPGGAEILED